MARVQEFYKGRRKKKNLAIIPFIVLLALVSVTLVTFYGMQKYAVITKDGVSVELPILDDGSKQVTVDSQGNEVGLFDSSGIRWRECTGAARDICPGGEHHAGEAQRVRRASGARKRTGAGDEAAHGRVSVGVAQQPCRGLRPQSAE